MALTSTPRRAGPYAGTGTLTPYPFAFKVFSPTDVQVTVTDPQGLELDATFGTDYTVALHADQDAQPGGSVAMVRPVLAGYSVTLTSRVPYDQPMVLTNLGGFYPEVLNDNADRQGIQIQQLLEWLSRTLSMPVGSELTYEQLLDMLTEAQAWADQALAIAGTVPPAYDTAAALRAAGTPAGISYATTGGALAAGDGGGGAWRWDASSTADDNTGTVLLPTGHVGPGRYVRVISGPYISIAWWLGAPDGSVQADSAFAAAFAVCLEAIGATNAYGGTVFCHKGVYEFSSCVIQPGRITVQGEGPYATRFEAADGFTGTVLWQLGDNESGSAPVVCRVRDALFSTRYQAGVTAVYSEWIQEDSGLFGCVVQHRHIGVHLKQNIPESRRPQNYTLRDLQVVCGFLEVGDELIGIWCNGGQATKVENVTIWARYSDGTSPSEGMGRGILCDTSWKGSLDAIHIEGFRVGIDLGDPDTSSPVTMANVLNVTGHPTENNTRDLIRINEDTTAVTLMGIQKAAATNAINDTQTGTLYTDNRIALWALGSGGTDAKKQRFFIGTLGEANLNDPVFTGTTDILGASANQAKIEGWVDGESYPRSEITNTFRVRVGDGTAALDATSQGISRDSAGDGLILGPDTWIVTPATGGVVYQDASGDRYYSWVDESGNLRISAANTKPSDRNADGTVVGTQT